MITQKRWKRFICGLIIASILLGSSLIGLLYLILREPSYQGLTLTQWLDQYSHSESIVNTSICNEAIQAMGRDCLPYLMSYLGDQDTHLHKIGRRLPFLERFIRISNPSYDEQNSRYRVPSILALKALGPEATEVVPNLIAIAEKKVRSFDGYAGLYALGTNAGTAFETLCQSTNSVVRRKAVMYLMTGHNAPELSFTWKNNPKTGRFDMGLIVQWKGSSQSSGLTNMLAHANPSVRHASVDALSWTIQMGSTSDSNIIVPALKRALTDKDRRVRDSAMAALSNNFPDKVKAE